MHDSFNQFFTGKEEQSSEGRLEDLKLEGRLLAHDRFKVIRKIGKGGFGTVWLCDDVAQGGKVAVKIVIALQNQGQALLEHAREELKRRKEIRHIAHILGANDLHLHREGEQELLLLPMEYADRGSLRDWMELHRPRCGAWPDLNERFSMFRNCCAGVDALHSAGLVHLDVKPENFLLVSEGDGQFRIKLGDFGLSRNVAQWATGTTGLMLPTRGTPTYMAPEQAKALNRRDLRAPVDIYALGVLLFELGAGYTPYEGATTPEQVMEMHQKEELQEHHFCDVPETWIPAIRSALAKKPAERPSSVRELLEMVKEGKARRSTVPPPPTKPEPTKAERVLMKKREDQCGDNPDAWDAVADEWEKVVGSADDAARCRNTARVLRERQAEWQKEQAEAQRLADLKATTEAAERAAAKLAAQQQAAEKARNDAAQLGFDAQITALKRLQQQTALVPYLAEVEGASGPWICRFGPENASLSVILHRASGGGLSLKEQARDTRCVLSIASLDPSRTLLADWIQQNCGNAAGPGQTRATSSPRRPSFEAEIAALQELKRSHPEWIHYLAPTTDGTWICRLGPDKRTVSMELWQSDQRMQIRESGREAGCTLDTNALIQMIRDERETVARIIARQMS